LIFDIVITHNGDEPLKDGMYVLPFLTKGMYNLKIGPVALFYSQEYASEILSLIASECKQYLRIFLS